MMSQILPQHPFPCKISSPAELLDNSRVAMECKNFLLHRSYSFLGYLLFCLFAFEALFFVLFIAQHTSPMRLLLLYVLHRCLMKPFTDFLLLWKVFLASRARVRYVPL